METQKKIGRNSMSIRSRRNIKAVSLCVAAALAQMAAIQARADSGVGQDTTIGNALNARPINTSTHRGTVSPDGMGTNTPVARTPSGQMYDMPISPAEEVNKTEGGWEYFGHVEAGVIGLGGDKKRHGFRRYKDVDGGLYINNFGLTAEKKDSASFFEIAGGSVAKDDQFYSVQFGRYNDWKLSGFYNETQHVFTSTFRSIYDGIGTGNLTLKPGLTAGGTAAPATDNANIAAIANANANTELGLVRIKGGVRFDMNLSDQWKVFASYTNEKREGARPFAAVWGGGGGSSPIEIAEPINYNSHDLITGLHYADDLNALNVQLSASWFRNNIDTLTFQTPVQIAAANGVAAGGFTQGRFDLYPNNDYYNIKAEYARNLPDFYKGRFTATTAFATSRQNDNLIPYTIQANNINVANVTGGAGAENWHTTASLSKQSAGARIDTKLINLGLALNPTDDLNVSGKLRYYETKNETEYLACNPNATYVDNDPVTGGNQTGGLSAYGCTGVWGRLINDGSGIVGGVGGAGILMGGNTTAAGNINIRNIPFDYKQLIYGVTGDYRINQANTVNLSYERETYKRDHRERDKTWEDKFKLTHVNRDLEDATLRWSFEHDRRRGSEYHTHHPYSPFYSGAIVAMPAAGNVLSWVVHMNTGLRKYDLSDRDQNILNARVNYMLRPDLDMGIAAQLKDTKYPEAQFGRTDKQTQNSLNFDLTWQPSEERSVYGFYSYQQGKLTQRGNVSQAGGALSCNLGAVINGITITAANAAQVCGMSLPGSTTWNSANAWAVKHKDDSDVIGFGWKEMFGEKRFDFNYNYARGKTAISYDLPGNIGAAPAGGGMPDLKTVSHVFEANLLIPVNKTVTSHLMLRHEIGKISDWHYTGLQDTPVAVNGAALPTAVILDAGPQNYKASMLGVMFNFKM